MDSFLYIADDIQTLSDGKMLVVGLYSDRTLNIGRDSASGEHSPPGTVPAVAQMCLMVTLTDVPEGTYEASTAFLAPDGTEFAKPVPVRSVVSTTGRSSNFLVRIAPFALPMPGTYKVITTLGAHRFEDSFQVRFTGDLVEAP